MIIKYNDIGIEVKFNVFTNRLLSANVIGEIKKTDSKNDSSKYKKSAHKKNPEDNLGSIVSILDTEKIEKGVDFISIDDSIKKLFNERSYNFKKLFESEELIASFCINYEMSLMEFIRVLMENYPEDVDIHFMRSVIKPFVIRIQQEKNYYELHKPKSESKRIFTCL